MNSSELTFIYKVRQALNQNLDHLHAPVIDRLAAARQTAIQRKKKSAPLHAWIFQYALADRIGHFFNDPSPWIRRIGLTVPVMIAVVGLAGIYQSTQQLRINEDAEIEAQIMADDLPLTAYLDKGFNTYLDEQKN
ncbi:MAG: DUF3619 family protein [Burkholderiaceae bacterium]